MQKDIFISYKAEEFKEAEWVKRKLEAQGISCWMAPADIPGGSSYASEIPAAIRACKIYVLILSSKAQESKWIPRELDQAINENKVIMPFMIENCALQDDFKFYLTNVQRYMAYEGKEKTVRKLIEDMKSILNAKEESVSITEDTSGETEINGEKGNIISKKKIVKEKSKKEKQNKEKKPSKAGIILAKVGVAILILLAVGSIIRDSNSVIIEGKRYNKSETVMYLSNVTLDKEEITNIGKLTELGVFALENCELQDADIGRMFGSNLHKLTLTNCGLTKEQLASIDWNGMTLRELDLSGNECLDSLEMIRPLADSLQMLDISNTSVTEIKDMAEFDDMVIFKADNNGISDISSLEHCKILKTLSLNGNEVTDISGLQVCRELTTVRLNANKIDSLAGLSNCIKLTEIQAGDNQITTLEGLENATILKYVYLSDNQISDIGILEKSAGSMKQLYVRNNQISDISMLESFFALTYIGLDGNQITTLEPLKNASGLVGVTASGNQITNTKGIEGRQTLLYVNLANNQLSEVGVEQPLSFEAGYGAILELSGNPLVKVNVVNEKNFALISLAGCEMTDTTFLYEVSANDLILDYAIPVDYAALKEANHYEYIVIDCPLDKQFALADLLGTYSTTFVESGTQIYRVEDYYDSAVFGSREYYK